MSPPRVAGALCAVLGLWMLHAGTPALIVGLFGAVVACVLGGIDSADRY